MIENVLHKIGGVGIFGIVSICLFFAFFTGMLIWATFLKKPYLHSMQTLPLEKDGRDSNSGWLNSPHPGPLPKGEGAAPGRAKVSRISKYSQQLKTVHPLPWGEGGGEGNLPF